MPNIDDLLKLSAPLAWNWAPRLCRRDPDTGEDCSPAHGIWQYLRLMGLSATIEPRRDFYISAVQAVTGTNGATRVLISGAADYALLDLVITAFRLRGVTPDITVSDLCETPLALNRWYAEQASCNIKTVRCDIMDLEATVGFDAVCSDFFLSKFPAARRGALLKKWHGLLRQGGTVITATRLRPASLGATASFLPDQVENLRATAAHVARQMQDSFGVDPEAFAGRAAVFAAKYITHTVHTREEVCALFEGCGFAMSHASVNHAPHTSTHGVKGPAMRGDAVHYLTVVARRL